MHKMNGSSTSVKDNAIKRKRNDENSEGTSSTTEYKANTEKDLEPEESESSSVIKVTTLMQEEISSMQRTMAKMEKRLRECDDDLEDNGCRFPKARCHGSMLESKLQLQDTVLRVVDENGRVVKSRSNTL